MEVKSDGGRKNGTDNPYFSICIPQHNRTSFLIEAVRSLGRQTFRDIEICVSDDCSTDGREDDLLAALRATGLAFTYRKQETNKRYDGNLRAAIDMSRGRYCYLLGNDDCPATDDELELLHADIENIGEVGVVIPNFRELPSGNVVRRMPKTENRGAGPRVAASNFRNFSFVSGVVLNGRRARALTTSKWDGSEMYQMYIGSRIIAEGLPLLAIERVAVLKDIQIPGDTVDTYAKRPRIDPCPIVERKHTFQQLSHLVIDAIEPVLSPRERDAMLEYVIDQVLVFTYPYWIFEYRRIQSWNYAAGLCLGMRPRNLTPERGLGMTARARVALVYAAVTTAGLAAPLGLFDAARPALHRLSKSGFGLPALRALAGRGA